MAPRPPLSSNPARREQPVQWALTVRALLAVLFGLSQGAMLLLAFWMPRITASLMATFFTGFALLDGLVALSAAVWGFRHGGRWGLLACSGLTGVVAGIAVLFRPPGMGALAILAWWAIIVGLLLAVEVLALRGGIAGRPLLAATAVLSVGFGVLILARPPQDLMTLAFYLAVFAIGLGILRAIIAFRVQSPDLA